MVLCQCLVANVWPSRLGFDPGFRFILDPNLNFRFHLCSFWNTITKLISIFKLITHDPIPHVKATPLSPRLIPSG